MMSTVQASEPHSAPSAVVVDIHDGNSNVPPDYGFSRDAFSELTPVDGPGDEDMDWSTPPEFIDSEPLPETPVTHHAPDAAKDSQVVLDTPASAQMPPEHEVAEALPAPLPAPVQAAAPTASLLAKPAAAARARTAAMLSRETATLDRLSDFRSPYAAAYLEVLEAQEAVEEAKAHVIEAEARIGEGLLALVTRAEQLLERADRVESRITLASDMLGQQAKLIAKAFREQLIADEMDGRATLKTHLLEVADVVANKATVALNQVADEAAAFTGVKAEAAALQRVTSVVMEQAKQAGLEQSVLALANVIGRLQTAAERIEKAPAQAPQPQQPQRQWAPEGLGAHRKLTLWFGHHLGSPGILIVLAGLGLLGWRLLG